MGGSWMSTNGSVLDRAETKDDVLQKYFDLIVDQAPVPVHVVDADFKITRVNQRWLDKLGYEGWEVLGRSPADFLSSESRVRAVGDVLPLFARVGSDRSVGLNFETKVGRVVPILMDAEVCAVDARLCHAFAVLRDPDDPAQYEEASATIEALHGIDVIQCEARRGPVAGESSADDIEDDGAGLLAANPEAMPWLSWVPRDLTRREQEVLEGLASGARNKAIAAELGISVRTARFHVEHIYEKLNVQTRSQATRAAIELGLITRDSRSSGGGSVEAPGRHLAHPVEQKRSNDRVEPLAKVA